MVQLTAGADSVNDLEVLRLGVTTELLGEIMRRLARFGRMKSECMTLPVRGRMR